MPGGNTAPGARLEATVAPAITTPAIISPATTPRTTIGEGEGATALPSPSPTFSDKIIGTNNGAGWGPAAAQTILAGHITWNRVEIGGPYNPISASQQEGFHTLAIVGNTEDGKPLKQTDPTSWGSSVAAQLQANPGISIAEAGNEMYLKGAIAEPVQYGKMYLAAINALKAAGIDTPLLFNMFGSYSQANGTWSVDEHNGGWLRDAVNGVPGLAAAILANGVSVHPYGALHENSADSYGVEAIAAQESLEQTVLGAIPPVYITEFGYDLGSCGQVDGACSQQEQAGKLRAAYEAFLANPHVAGIWCYQSHDDGTGRWGYMNDDNTTRPSFNVLSSFAIAEGQ